MPGIIPPMETDSGYTLALVDRHMSKKKCISQVVLA